MENNKLLIGVQFTDLDHSDKHQALNIELYVVRDITLAQLIEGVKYGLIRLAARKDGDTAIYSKCIDIFNRCNLKTIEATNGKTCYEYITYTAFNGAQRGGRKLWMQEVKKAPEDKVRSLHQWSVKQEEKKYLCRLAFTPKDMERPLCDLGFITSTRLIFDATGIFEPKGSIDTESVIEAFDPHCSQKLFFPEYNISTRQLYCFDDAPVKIIPPTDPPRKPDQSLMSLLLPSLCSVGVMLILRTFLSGGGSGLTMALMSVGMGVAAAIVTTMNWRKQNKAFEKNLSQWREQYEGYVNNLMDSVAERQKKDVLKLNTLYPDMLSLIEPGEGGIYALNEHVYSRSPAEEDFLAFRIGVSDQVPSRFEVKGEDKDVVFSDTFYRFDRDNSYRDRLHIICGSQGEPHTEYNENLCMLPGTLSRKYKFLQNAPLMYSLKSKGCLGVVDRDCRKIDSRAEYFISRMLFELCYYHAPEKLQFVVFFREEHNWNTIEEKINRYKFMPHFRGLFSDMSQFVFDKASAHMVLNNLMTIMNSRRMNTSENGSKDMPHIVMVIFEEHGMKEHAFAEYLPQAPASDEPNDNYLGLTFVNVVSYKEHLPAYCDDVICFNDRSMTLTPHHDITKQVNFRYDFWDTASDRKQFLMQYTTNETRAFRFLSSIYYAQIAQNGRVPSAVSMYEMINRPESAGQIDQFIREHWGIGVDRNQPSITKSLAVPLGKTETGIAYLDLHEKADGPHMLVAGTTGSGKTETVISYLLGLCINFRPDELNMLLVDMKGGGFTKRIGHLPHVVGSVTDVDGDENGTSADYMLRRFLNAMQSEIKRRKLLFNRLHVDSIDGYIEACNHIEAHIEKKKIVGDEAALVRETAKTDRLSHLLLVVDEFTELKRFSSENGDLDFMGEITTLARVGRSLGFHIILISQNIEGAITDDIRVNSRARLCLKVATRQASKEMIGNDLAASPFMPGNGRAYLLVGTGSKFEYFQSAYSGAGTEERIPVEITLASKSGRYTRFYRSDKDNREQLRRIAELKRAGAEKSQLEEIAASICRMYEKHSDILAAPHVVFSSPLSTRIAWDPKSNVVVDLSKRKQVKS